MQRESLYDWCNNNGNRGKQLLNEWTGTDENNRFINIRVVTKGSGKKAYWKCTKGHGTWLATINNRTASNQGCPLCYESNRSQIVRKGKTQKGVNDLLTWCNNNGEYGKQLYNEWTGIDDKGNHFEIDEITAGSNKKFLWKCSENANHKWIVNVLHRTSCASKCPYCCNQKTLSGENDLQTWCENNNKNNIIEQWVGIDEKGNKVSMQEVAPTSHKKVKWRHTTDDNKTHEWIAAISDRVAKDSGCPLCTGMNNLKPGINDLETWCNNNGNHGKLLKEQWIGLDEQGSNILITDITYGSKQKVGWLCSCGNIWYTTPLIRTLQMSKCCDECTRKIMSKKAHERALENGISLDEWCKNNNEFGDMLRTQYTGIDTEGNFIPINKITCGSNRKMCWEHHTSKGELHKWVASIGNRTAHYTSCPYCNNKGTSLPEQIIYRCFKQLYPNTISRGKFQGYEFDITIPELKTCIEYGSTFYHDGRKKRDTEKKALCEQYNVNFIQIIDDSDDELDKIWRSNLIVVRITNNVIREIYAIVAYIFKNFNLDITDIDYTKAVHDAKEFMYN